MQLRRITAAASIAALAFVGLAGPASADSTFSVSDTTITAGGTVKVTLNEACTDGEGQDNGGHVTSSAGQTKDTHGDSFVNGNTFTFDTPGSYTLTRYCDTWGFCSQVTITVSEPATTTTTSTTTVPVETTTTTTPSVTTTTIAAVVEGTSVTSSAPVAAAATPVRSAVNFAG